MTQLDNAASGTLSPEMDRCAADESIRPQTLLEDIKAGYTVICKSTLHACTPVGIGKNLRIKINANIGTSAGCCDPEKELEKLAVSVRYGADTVMDLSTGGDINGMRRRIIDAAGVPIGTVPIYQVITQTPDVARVTEEDFLRSIERHIHDGVDFVTVHCGISRDYIPLIRKRIMGVVSRGGSFLIKWMLHHGKENPLLTHYDDILAMARKHDVVLSLGDGLRPGCLADATDSAQLAELKTLGTLAQRAREKGVQVMIEGPGHVPLHQIKENIELEKKYCNGAPFYVLGPLVTDIAPGYDHIVGAIGGTLAAVYGADFLCYLTPTEHLGLPDVQHVIDGVIASKIAAHAADIARGIPGARARDDAMAMARSNLDWPGMFAQSMNPEKARELHGRDVTAGTETCTMCGEFCSARTNRDLKEGY